MADLNLRTQAHELCFGYPHATLRLFSSTKTEEASGFVVVRRTNDRRRRSWTLRWRTAPRGTFNEVKRRLDATKGGALSMTFTPMDETDATMIRVKLVPNSLRVRLATRESVDMSFSIVEDF